MRLPRVALRVCAFWHVGAAPHRTVHMCIAAAGIAQTHKRHCRTAPFVTHISAAVVSIDWLARRAHVALLSPSSSAADVAVVPDASVSFPVGARLASRFDDALRPRCAMNRAWQHVPSVCGRAALASLVLCCCAAAVAVVWVGVAASRALLLKPKCTKWERRPYKDRHEKL